MKIGFCIYSKFKDEKCPEGDVGISFPPTPSLSYGELLDLISQLSRIVRKMDGREKMDERD